MADEQPTKSASPEVTAGATPAAPAAPAGRATTCAQCNKRLDRKKQYYRNGRYFCNKRCWHTSAIGVPPQPQTAG